MTTDSETMEQYLNFVLTRFLISVLVFVSRDYELETKFWLIVVYLLRKNMEIEVSAFGNVSTDTGSTDCKHPRSRSSVPYGADFSCLLSVRSSQGLRKSTGDLLNFTFIFLFFMAAIICFFYLGLTVMGTVTSISKWPILLAENSLLLWFANINDHRCIWMDLYHISLQVVYSVLIVWCSSLKCVCVLRMQCCCCAFELKCWVMCSY